MIINNNLKTIILLIFFLYIPLNVIAKEFKVTAIDKPIVIANKFSIRSKTLNDIRSFYVHLPTGYKESNRYPVLYIPDAKRKMKKTVAITDDLADFAGRIPKMIVVGIETNKNRKGDLSSTISSKLFLTFITKELKPYIESQYQTNGENLLMGSSMGGEFVVRALLDQPEEFDAYFSISPSIYYSDFQLVKKAIEISEGKQSINKKLYLSVANEGWNQGVEELVYSLRKYPIQGLQWKFTKLETESHGSISMGQGYQGLQSYYALWTKPHFKNTTDFESKGGLLGLKDVYTTRNLSIVPISILDHMALLYVDEKNVEQAIKLSLFAVKQHPTSGSALRNLAYVYEKLKMPKKALVTYEKALSIAIENKHRKSSIESHKRVLAEFKSKNKVI